ncbi:transcription factor IIIC subunit delta N-term-domain-containing protein [Aspergillus coremiiformis]|uniref:Transcription factor IIIC subunit delta N-term-domain-containing protein n=1 Tax=Aspergillus coremiiformis TaxID=138285 RepID=A0A5N6ZD94_9EURO|nr:transcription factor IIIC subunit delta N-term-domain-containing protein [Aspergillus coremiiformis]
MLGPVELQLFPSCYNCMSWSADGEIAVAAGEYVQILTPKQTTEKGANGSGSQATSQNWNVTRIRVNVFTNQEWPIIYPQKRENFSIGPEQSLSTVVGLAWSPPGLAKYRRCILAVLTSSLVLSFYDIGPQGKWSRVAIVNDCLNPYFKSLVDDEELRLRKFNIRAFSWCPPLKVPVAEQRATDYSVPPSESRWGMYFLAITNDDNDEVLVHTRRSTDVTSVSPYSFEVLSHTSVDEHLEDYQTTQPGTLFSSALKARTRATSISAGPWIYQPTRDSTSVCSALGNVAITWGTKLKIVRHVITLMSADQQTSAAVKYKVRCDSDEDTTSHGGLPSNYHLTGPLQWLYTDESFEIGLAAASFAGMFVLRFSRAAYQGQKAAGQVQVKEFPFYETTGVGMGDDPPRHWEQTTAMVIALDEESQTPILHLGTVGGYTATMTLSGIQQSYGLPQAPWKRQLENVREQLDIARDLGGYTIARIWGLASCDGLVVAAITVHTGDSIEYRTSAEERTTLIFSHANTELTESDLVLSRPVPDRSPDTLRKQREGVLGYILFVENGDYSRLSLSRKLLYAAACCAIVDSQNEKVLSQARKALDWLASVAKVDLADEITKCSTPGNTIEAKSTEQLNGLGQHLFEQCAICDAGMSWYSAMEAQCAAGHLFVRCGVTFLAIQEPGVSKLCSRCGIEYLSEDLVHDELKHTCRLLSDVFDTCPYCGGKFQA